MIERPPGGNESSTKEAPLGAIHALKNPSTPSFWAPWTGAVTRPVMPLKIPYCVVIHMEEPAKIVSCA